MLDSRPGRLARTPGWVLALLVVLALIAGTLLLAQQQSRLTTGARRAVESYLALIVDGDLAAATALVPPARWSGWPAPGVDVASSGLQQVPALLDGTHQPLESIEVTAVSIGAAQEDGTVAATIDYTLGSMAHRSRLRVRPHPVHWWGGVRWQVVDPLLLPVVVETNLVQLSPGLLGGAAVPLSRSYTPNAAAVAVLAYPGVYTLGAREHEYVVAKASHVIVGHALTRIRQPDLGPAVQASMWFSARTGLARLVRTGATARLTRCFADPDRSGCRRIDTSGGQLLGEAVLIGIGNYSTSYRDGVAQQAGFPVQIAYRMRDRHGTDSTASLTAEVVIGADSASLRWPS